MKILLPIKPKSVNECWQGRRYRTADYGEWQKEGLWLLKGQPYIGGKVAIRVKWYTNRVGLMDIDNPVKPILDLLVAAEIIDDDRNVWRLEVEKGRGEPRYEIEILPIGDNSNNPLPEPKEKS